MSRFVTISEIARIFGVAPSTVSRALKDHPRISKKLCQQIQAKARELGYLPNRYSGVLKAQKTFQVGIIIPDLNTHFYTRILKAVSGQTAKTDYTLVVGHSDEKQAEEAKIIDKFIAQRVDGILAATTMESENQSGYEKIVKHEIPLVFFDRVNHFVPALKVVADDYHAAYEATRYLIKSGCLQIAHITATKRLNNSNNRLYGYMDALKAHNLPIDEELIFYYEFEQQAIDHFLHKIMTSYPGIDGFFVFNDYVANRVVHQLIKHGKKIPDEISVIGCSDEPIAHQMTPQLTTLEDIAEKMGSIACKQLIDRIEGGSTSYEKVIIDQNLILRETTRK